MSVAEFFSNYKTASKIIKFVSPGFKHRWEVLDGILKRYVGQGARWLDCGCGDNRTIEEFPCDFRIGIDRIKHPHIHLDSDVFFLFADSASLPFHDGFFTIIILKDVVEHFEQPDIVFHELNRVLSSGGYLLIQTTHKKSPVIFMGKLIPDFLRNCIIKYFFGANPEDVFPAHHKCNTFKEISSIEGFQIEEFHYIQDVNPSNRIYFVIMLLIQVLSRTPLFSGLRSNIVTLLRKTND
jgi:SAM-dependent methyltransferase